MARLKAVPATSAEQKAEELLIAVAKEHSRRFHDQAPVALIGGTALKHILGVTRPTLDLDLSKREESRDIARDEIVPILKDMGYRTRVDERRKTRLRTPIQYKRWWWPRWKHLIVDEPTTAGRVDETPGRSKGITTYSERGLVESKLQAVLRRRPGTKRVKARDLYDCAWIVENRPDLVAPEQAEGLRKLLRTLEQPERRAEWEDAFRKDLIMRRTTLQEVTDALTQGLERHHQSS